MKESLAGLAVLSLPGAVSYSKPSAGSPGVGDGAEVRLINGIPELFVNGSQQSRMWGRLALPADYAPEKLEQYRGAGINTYFTACDSAVSLCWNGKDEFFFDKYEVNLRRLVDIMPDIQLILYVGGTGGAPYLWARDNKEELTLYDNGARFEAASIASEKWFHDSSKAFAEFVKYFENSKYSKNIIGYNPVFNANEWFSHHRVDGVMHGWPDFSKPMLRKFRSWLMDKYAGDEKHLRESWNDENVTFETVEIPTWPERLKADDPDFFTSCTHGNRIVDYFMCYDEALADLAIGYCRTVKQASTVPKITGMMHAYSFCGRYAIIPHHHGHGAAMKILKSPHVDFLHSPYHYYNRSIGGPHYSQHSADSVSLHGKLMVDQIDTKSHLRHGPNHNASNPWESEQILKRDVSYSLSKNFYCYWLEGGPGNMFPVVRFSPRRFSNLWYDDPEIKKTIGRLKKLDDENQREKPENVSEVAIFTSSKGFYFRKMENMHGRLYVEAFRQWILPEAGVPFDDYILEDFVNLKRDYQVYIFLNPYYIDEKLRKAISEKLRATGATALWFYAPGYQSDTGCGLENIEALSGIRMNRADKRDYIQVQTESSGHPLLKGVASGTEFGSDADPDYFQKGLLWMRWPRDKETYKFSPAFYADDPDAETLGTLKGLGKPGLVIKDNGAFTSVFSSAPMLPAAILINILDQAGVHLYSKDRDLVYANSRYITVCANGGGGEKVLHLPGKTDLFDALSGKKLASQTRQYSYEAKHKETFIFRIQKS